MSPLAVFLILIVSLTALLVAYLTKQFQEENLIYSNKNPMTNSNTKTKTKKWKTQNLATGKMQKELMEEWQ